MFELGRECLTIPANASLNPEYCKNTNLAIVDDTIAMTEK